MQKSNESSNPGKDLVKRLKEYSTKFKKPKPPNPKQFFVIDKDTKKN